MHSTKVRALPFSSSLPNQYPQQEPSTILIYAIPGSQGAQFEHYGFLRY